MKKAFLLLMTLLAMAGMNMAQDIYSMGYYNIGETGLTVPALYKNGSMIQAFTTEQWYGEGTDVLVAQNGKVYCAYNVREVVENNYGPWCAYVYNTDGTYLLDAGYGTRIYAICEGNDGTIYSFGNVKFGEGGNAVWRAAYWVNGSTTPVYLSDILNRDSYAKDGCVDEEGNVYAVGYQYTDNFYEHFYGKVWRNGAEWQSFGSQTTAESVAIYEGDVYTAGQYDEAGETSAMVWKNSSVHYTLPHEGTESYANGICIYDGDIYVAGMDEDGYGEGKDGNPISRLTVWKNGTVHYSIACSDDEGDRSMNAVVATSSGVYSAGSRYGQGKIWKDGVVHYSPEQCVCINAICYGELGYAITATANPEAGGTISGTGIYGENETCTLTATPNPGYGFVNWTENGMVVSTDATYNFTVTSNRYLVANFGLRRNISATANPEAGGEIASSGGITGQIGELTVHDGTTTSNQVPFYGLWVDDFTRNEMIYPAAELRFMNGGDINSLTFYKNATNTNSWETASFQIYLKEVASTTLNDYIGMTGATVVYEGSVDAVGGERQVTINFTTPYHYNGGNLLVGVYQTITGSYSSAYWYGEEVAGASASGYNSSSTANASFYQRNFLPKTTFSFTGITYYVEGSSCTFTATPNEGYTFVNWKKDNGLTVSNSATYSFVVTESVSLEATFEPTENVYIGDEGTKTSTYLPSNSRYNYTLSQQIYTAEEIGPAGYLNCIAFYNAGGQKTRNLDVYLVHTEKTQFEHSKDWIIADEADRVFSGSVTLYHNNWTWIVFDTPFPYNGTSNLALIVNDNTGSYTNDNEMKCLVFDAPNQSLFVYGNYSNFDPLYIPSYDDGHRPNVKNQVKIGKDIVPNPATITASVYQLTGGTVSGGGVFTIGSTCTLTAIPGSLDFVHWMKDGEVVSTDATYSFEVTEDAHYVAYFGQNQSEVYIGDGGSASGMYLPTTSTLNYSLTQQIYTANEIGRMGTITSVAFFNISNGATCTRSLDLYLVPTDKTVFASATDWVSVTEADRVFSGNVTFTAGEWTPILLDTPFDYDGTSNLVLVVDDNTGSTTGSIMYGSQFNAQGQQALYINGGDNYDPLAPDYTGSLMTVKNQIKLSWPPAMPHFITVTTEPDWWGDVSVTPPTSYHLQGSTCTLTATPYDGYAFINWTKDGTVVSTDPTYSFIVTEDASFVAHFGQTQEVYIGDGSSTGFYLPSYTSYKYSLSQQIYTADEIGSAGIITRIAFYHNLDTDTRTWDIYLTPTDKTVFGDEDGWEAVIEADRVFSGSVTLAGNDWTWIIFEKPFFYDGTSNLILTVDDNSANQGSQQMFAAFSTDAPQALYNANNATNYDPEDPSNYGAFPKNYKNQIKLDKVSTSTCYVWAWYYPLNSYYEEVYGVGSTCTLTAPPIENFVFIYWAIDDGTYSNVVSTESTYSFTVTEDVGLVAVYGTPQNIYIGNGNIESTYGNQPTDASSKYSLTEQIYTADELGEAGTITSITFHNGNGPSLLMDRELDIYLVPTDKTVFQNENDWIPVTAANRVFSGTVTTTTPTTTIAFDTPFTYDGTSNLALVVLDYTGVAVAHLNYYMFDTNGYQALWVSGNTSAYDPHYPETYSGTLQSEKNQITLSKASFQTWCDIQATVNPEECGYLMGGGYASGSYYYTSYLSGTTCTLTAVPETGYDFVCWTKDGVEVSSDATYTFTVTESAEYVANFGLTQDTYIGDGGTSTSSSLPTDASYAYFLSEQIYTADELGGAETFTHIAFYNAGTAYNTGTDTRTFDIYLVPTDKVAFESNTDWMPVTEADLVFSGEVTLAKDKWSWIPLDTPFAYDGVSNLALIVDDNTGSIQGSTYCRTFNTTTTQTLRRRWGSGADINPMTISSNGILVSQKNQIKLRRAGIAEPFTITATVDPEEGGLVNGDSYYSETFYSNHWVPSFYDFEDGTLQGWTTIDADGDTYTWGNYGTGSIVVHSGTHSVASASYINDLGALTPDNWLVSPQMTLGDIMSFWACGQDPSWAHEHFAVYVSTSGNSVSDFTEVMPETVATATMTQYTVDLSAYEGQTGYVAIRHFNVTDMYRLNIDDISLGSFSHAGVETPTCTLAATTNPGFDFMGWTKDGVLVSTDNPYTFPVTENANIVAHFGQSQEIYIGDGGSALYNFLPSRVNRNYSLSQQIYTAEEIGGAGTITRLAFSNFFESATRTWDIYLKSTDKAAFESESDWVAVTEADRVFSGTVTITDNGWSWINFDTPFFYDGTTNLVLVVDDNTAVQVEVLGCEIFNTDGQQALFINGDDTNFDLTALAGYSGTLKTFKNQIILDGVFGQKSYITATANPTQGGSIDFHLPDYDFNDGTLQGWTNIDADGDGYKWYNNNGCVASRSWLSSAGALNPDNYLVSPLMEINGYFSFLARNGHSNYIEHFGVAVSTTSDTEASAFTTIAEWNSTSAWTLYAVDLSAYAGQMGYVAIRHFDSFDMFQLEVDDISLQAQSSAYYPQGTTCTLTAIPAMGYAFSAWTDSNGSVVSTDVTYSFTVTEDANYVANFAKNDASDLYVSRTGWATWDGDGFNAPEVIDFSYGFSEDFEGGIPDGWTTEGDGYWIVSTGDATGGNALGGSYNMLYDPNSPDDAYLVTPMMDLSRATEGTLNFRFTNRNLNDNVNPFGVYYRVDGGDWHELYYTEHYHEATSYMALTLEGFAGNYQIGFKGFHNPDGAGVALDNVNLSVGVGSGTRSFQNIQLTLSDLDDNVIYTGTTPNNYVQLPTDGLTEGEVYRLTVAQNYESGLSGEVTCTWLYEPCSNFEGVSNFNSEVNDQGVTLTWDLPETTPAEPTETGWYYYDNGVSNGWAYGAIDWGIMIPAGSYAGNAVWKVSAYDAASMMGTVTIYNDGSTAPALPVGSREVAFTYAHQFVEFEFEEPIEIDPTKNIWVVFHKESGDEYPAAICDNTGDPNGRWCSLDGVTWKNIDDDLGYSYTFMVRAYIMDNSNEPAPVGAPYGVAVFREGEWIGLTAGYDSFTDSEGTANSQYEVRVVYSGPSRMPYKNAYYAMSCPQSTETYEITAEANPAEGGTVRGAGSYSVGSTAILTATPNEGWSFVNWTRNGAVVSPEAIYSLTVTEDASFVANFEEITYEVTATANPSEGGTLTGAGTYPYGAEVTLTATPNAGYTFVNWTKEDNTEVATTTTFTIPSLTEDLAFVAHFSLNSYEITVAADPTEGGTVSGAGTYGYGTSCTLTATANEGYTFVNWTKDGIQASTNASYTFNVTEGGAYVAHFSENAPDIYLITATADPVEGGIVTGTGTYTSGQSCTLTAMANTGYTFVKWTKDGTQVSTIATYTFTVSEAGEYVAHFAQNSYDLTVTANPSEGGTVTGTGTYGYGTTVTLTATANAGYTFVNWTLNSTEISTEATCTVTVTGSSTYVANFELNTYDITATADPTEGGTVTGAGTFNHGASCTLTATANEGYTFVNWTKGGSVVSSAQAYTFTVTEGGAYVAHFMVAGSGDVQVTNFVQGCNWWSGYVELGSDGLTQLEEGLGNNGITIKSQHDGYNSYLEGLGWYGGLTSINNESSYQIRTTGPCTVNFTGSEVNPANHPITLSSGWSWIGYPVNTSQSITDAFSGITAQMGDMVKSQNDGYASYLEGFGWYGALTTLSPGMGLMYKSFNTEAVTFTYPNDGGKGELKPNQKADNNHWKPNLNAYMDNMSVMAVVELNDEELRGTNYELAAFANGECRGSVRLLYVDPINRYIAFLTVAGEEAAILSFGLYNTETGEEYYNAAEPLIYETNAVFGSFVEPYVVSFRSTTGMDEWANNLNIFPNPVNCGQNVSLGFNDAETGKVQVEIIDALGAVVETRRATSFQTIQAPNTVGVYTLRITVEGKGTCYRKLVVR